MRSNCTLSSIRTISSTCRFHSVRYACTGDATAVYSGSGYKSLNGDSRGIVLDDRDYRTHERRNINIILFTTDFLVPRPRSLGSLRSFVAEYISILQIAVIFTATYLFVYFYFLRLTYRLQEFNATF